MSGTISRVMVQYGALSCCREMWQELMRTSETIWMSGGWDWGQEKLTCAVHYNQVEELKASIMSPVKLALSKVEKLTFLLSFSVEKRQLDI